MRVEALLQEREWLSRLARRLVSDPGAAEDLAQEALMRALETGGPTGPGSASRMTMRGWFSTTLRDGLGDIGDWYIDIAAYFTPAAQVRSFDRLSD